MDFSVGIQNALNRFDERSRNQRDAFSSSHQIVVAELSSEAKTINLDDVQEKDEKTGHDALDQDQLRKTISNWSLELLSSKF